MMKILKTVWLVLILVQSANGQQITTKENSRFRYENFGATLGSYSLNSKSKNLVGSSESLSGLSIQLEGVFSYKKKHLIATRFTYGEEFEVCILGCGLLHKYRGLDMLYGREYELLSWLSSEIFLGIGVQYHTDLEREYLNLGSNFSKIMGQSEWAFAIPLDIKLLGQTSESWSIGLAGGMDFVSVGNHFLGRGGVQVRYSLN